MFKSAADGDLRGARRAQLCMLFTFTFGHDPKVHSLQGRGWSRERMAREVTQEKALSSLFYASANVFL